MQKIMLIMVMILVTLSCKPTGKKISDNKESILTKSGVNQSNKNYNWCDKLILNYIKKSDNKLIKSSRKDTSIRIEWMLDRVENSDTSKYFIFHIGHNVVDKGDINLRVVTDDWVYIDSLSRKFYVYDLPHDSLIEWKK